MHYTYKQPEDDLQQGDILEIDEGVKKVLSEYHPYYSSHDDYSHVIVLTQSCDLKRRNGSCKSRYITLAAVRSFETAINREIEKYKTSSVEVRANICGFQKKSMFEDFLIKLINNNLPSYFYLAEDQNNEFIGDKVAFLNLSVPIKSEHYDVCLHTRRLQLTEIFQAKLGWLVGNMYSRVGTPDWFPIQGTEDEFKKMIQDLLDKTCYWVDDSTVSFLNNELKQRRKIEGRSYFFNEDELQKLIIDFISEKENKKTKIIDGLIEEVQRTLETVSPEELISLKGRLYNSQHLSDL